MDIIKTSCPFEFATWLYGIPKSDLKAAGFDQKRLQQHLANSTDCILGEKPAYFLNLHHLGRLISTRFDGDFNYVSSKLPIGIALKIAGAKLSSATLRSDANRNLQAQMIREVYAFDIPKKIALIANKRKSIILNSDLWSFGNNDARFGIKHPGRIPGQIVANVLHHFAPDAQLVLDPMAGGGVTRDVCKWYNSSIKTTSFDLVPKRDFINEKDCLEEWDIPPQDLIIIDPPYFDLIASEYVPTPFTADFDSFKLSIKRLFELCVKYLKKDGVVAFVMQPKIEPAWIDLPFVCQEIAQISGLGSISRIQIPLSSQQIPAWKTGIAGRSRDLIIFKKH